MDSLSINSWAQAELAVLADERRAERVGRTKAEVSCRGFSCYLIFFGRCNAWEGD